MSDKEQENSFRLLNERETARRLAVSAHALRYWRANGGGPPWVRVGERLVRYEMDALRGWIERQARVRDGR
jgi:DNA-binding transcriptional MerR regulator